MRDGHNLFYLVIIGVLFLLAISDLVVGVSNDAVNFLNSAVGAKAASLKTIMAVAAVGILFGCTFSSGMMEVARKGIFNPEMFFFSEIINCKRKHGNGCNRPSKKCKTNWASQLN